MEYEYWLSAIEGLSDRKKLLLRSYMKTARDVYYIEETKLYSFQFLNEKDKNTIRQAQKGWNLEKEYQKLEKKQIRMIPYFDAEYPARLKRIPDYPYTIYVKGSLPDEECISAAIVGARRCTPYGERYAYEFAEALSQCGVQVISGMAKGIDGTGHRGALMGKGKTFAVLGCGVDVCYPAEHIGLYADILEQGGGILSEFPPGVKPLPYHFPQRNRIISGLADLVMVMEAKEKSGSLITADLALEQGKDVYALPGPVDSALSRGCNRLIQEGAGILLTPEILLEQIGIFTKNPGEKASGMKKVLETTENLVYSSVCLYPKSADQIIEETKLPAQEVMCLLASLEIDGYIMEKSKNYYIRVK